MRGQNGSSRRVTRLVLAASESICRIFNVYENRRFSLAVRCIVGSLTPTIDANFRNDCSRSSEISAWALSTTAKGPRDALFLCEWLFLADILKLSLDYSKAIYFVNVINGDLGYPSSAKTFDDRGSSIIPHLVSTSRLFWEYDCLLEASGFLRHQQ